MKFKVTPHSIRPDVETVEVFNDQGEFIATITAGEDDNEIRVVSKHMDRVRVAPPSSLLPVPAARIYLKEQDNENN